MVKDHWIGVVGAALLVAAVLPRLLTSQTQAGQAPGIYARIAILRAMDGHSVDWEAGYIRQLEWHRQAKDPLAGYSYSVWASTERQRWIIHATFGHTAAELSHYEFLPSRSRGKGVPTPTARAEYTTADLNCGTGRAFEAALAAEQPKLQGVTF
jgi:hypothetical protein